FKLTVRDNRAGGGGVVSSGSSGCQTTDVFQVNVAGTEPFLVTSPNGGESYMGGSTQTITWNVAGTNLVPFDVTNVKISLSTDGGLTYPTVIAASTPTDGSEDLVIPAIVTTTARIKIEAIGNIFFDISNANFTITMPASSFDFVNPGNTSVACAGPTTAVASLSTTATGGFSTPIDLSYTLSGTNFPPGTTVTFGTDPVNPGSSTTVTLNNVNNMVNGIYVVTVTGTAGTITKNINLNFVVQTGTAPSISTQPAPTQVLCSGDDATFSVTSPGAISYQWYVSTDGGSTFTEIAGGNSATY